MNVAFAQMEKKSIFRFWWQEVNSAFDAQEAMEIYLNSFLALTIC